MKHPSLILLGALLASVLLLAAARGEEPGWKAGLAHVKITPEKPVFLAGYASRNKPFERVECDLSAKALALDDGRGHKAVLVTSDLIGLPAAVSEPVCERIGRQTGLKREQILFNSSHTHTGPTLRLQAAAADGQSVADAERTVEYTKQLQDKLVEVVGRSLEHMEPARLSWSTGVVHFVMNRREFTPEGVILGVNPRGLADRTVPVLRVDTPQGKPRAVLFGAAVHGTTLTGDCYDVSGDYAGFAQALLEQRHPGVQAMFMIGCAGDANPYPRGTMQLAKQHGTTLAEEVDRVLQTKLKPVRGPLMVAFGKADLPLQPIPPRSELEKQAAGKRGIQPWVAQQMLTKLGKGEKLPTHYPAPVAVWQFGHDLTVVGLSGEVVVEYVTMLEKALGPNRLWVTAYCNDVFGYLPSARILGEGGYETRGLYSGGIGLFSPEAQDVIVAKVKELASQVGRAIPAK